MHGITYAIETYHVYMDTHFNKHDGAIKSHPYGYKGIMYIYVVYNNLNKALKKSISYKMQIALQ